MILARFLGPPTGSGLEGPQARICDRDRDSGGLGLGIGRRFPFKFIGGQL